MQTPDFMWIAGRILPLTTRLNNKSFITRQLITREGDTTTSITAGGEKRNGGASGLKRRLSKPTLFSSLFLLIRKTTVVNGDIETATIHKIK